MGSTPTVTPKAGRPLTLTPRSIPARCRRTSLTPRAVDDSLLILDRSRGQLHQLNPTAGFIWDRCDGARQISDIAARLVEAFDVDYATAERDVLLTVRRLGEHGLLTINNCE